jgi:hypothetical protein
MNINAGNRRPASELQLGRSDVIGDIRSRPAIEEFSDILESLVK